MSILHEFAGGAGDGAYPPGALLVNGSTLYGVTFLGGASNMGVVLSLETGTCAFVPLHEFAGPALDGSFPRGGLTLFGGALYGFVQEALFSMALDGSGLSLLHEFDSSAKDPRGSLTLSGATLYGVTHDGGYQHHGTLFSIGVDGTGFTVLHTFMGQPNDGGKPHGRLVVDGSTLYGTTFLDGSYGNGTVFAVQTDGTSFELLHDFAGGSGDGARPLGGLTLFGSTLYGTTVLGGSSSKGVVFSMATDGSGFTVLHSFTGGDNDGAYPQSAVTLVGSTLYGTTLNGGDHNMGVVFALGTGGGYSVLHEFSGGPDDGAYPQGELSASGSMLYGMTLRGGDADKGVVFVLESGLIFADGFESGGTTGWSLTLP